VNNKTLAIWAEILHSCPNARLLLKSNLFKDKQFKEEMQHRLISLSIPIDRVIFEEGSPRTQYLESYQRADFMLDTFPFPGGTTTCEALWMGVPTLTLAGNTLLERQGMSMLNCVGLDNWVTHSEAEYIEKAIYFTQHLDYLTTLRSTLRKKMAESPLVNATLFARDFELAMLEMWQAKSDK
jgi:predicted O-linked N-acetylglucosamine transferase (SPINDLY family)